MSILNISGTFGLLGLFKTWSSDAARVDGGTAGVRTAETPVRRTRTAPVAPLRDVDRFFEEDCERWDGLA